MLVKNTEELNIFPVSHTRSCDFLPIYYCLHTILPCAFVQHGMTCGKFSCPLNIVFFLEDISVSPSEYGQYVIWKFRYLTLPIFLGTLLKKGV